MDPVAPPLSSSWDPQLGLPGLPGDPPVEFRADSNGIGGSALGPPLRIQQGGPSGTSYYHHSTQLDEATLVV